MQKKNYRGTRCEKRKFSKCQEVCRSYSAIHSKYAEKLEERADIRSFQCNVLLPDLGQGQYTTDFVAVKEDGSLLVRECVWRKHLQKPMTLKLLDASRDYWRTRGVEDWGIVIDAEKE